MLNIAWCAPSEAIELILALFQNKETQKHTPMLHGAPGVGKSTVARVVAQEMGAELIDLRLCQLEPTDIRGQMVVDPVSRTTIAMRPEFLPEYTEDPNARKYLIFLDEILAAHDNIRKAAFQLVLDRHVGPHRIGPNVYIMAAGNTVEDGTNIYEMDSATADRFLHIGISTSVESFIRHAEANDFHADVIAFLKANMMVFEPTQEERAEGRIALPSPRSFERWSEIMHAGLQGRMLEIALKGWCGEQVGAMFLAALAEKEQQFDLMQLIQAKRPEDRRYPTSQFGQLSLAHNLLAWAKTPEQLDKAIDIMIAMPNEGDATLDSKTFFINSIAEHPAMNQRKFMELALNKEIARFMDARRKILDQGSQEE